MFTVGQEDNLWPMTRDVLRRLLVRIGERDVRQAAKHLQAVAARADLLTVPTGERVSPLARRLAATLGLDADRLAVEQPGKRIERAGVEAAARRIIGPGVTQPISREVVAPMTAICRTIRERPRP